MRTLGNMNLLWTPRFKSQLSRYTGIQTGVVKRVCELIRKSESNPDLWHRYEEKLKDDSFGNVQAYKTAVTNGDRLVYVLSGSDLVLVDIGRHEIMDEYSRLPRVAREKDLANAQVPEPWFIEEIEQALQVKNSSRKVKVRQKIDISEILSEQVNGEEFRLTFEEELDDSWIHFLDENQTKVADKIEKDICNGKSDLKIHYILGGPGTGKTIVLLNLAIRFSNMGRAVSFELSPPVLKYLNSGRTRVPGANLGPGPGVILLVDDPADVRSMAGIVRLARSSKCAAIIIALDPLQWHEKEMPETFEKIWSSQECSTHLLQVCYRQSAGVAKKSLNLLATLLNKNSRFLVQEKQIAEKVNLAPYLNIALEMQFVDEAGRYKTYLENTQENFIKEVSRFRSREFRWKHTHPIAFVFGDDIPIEVRKFAKIESNGLNRVEHLYSNYRDFRGVEFQELFLFVSIEFWEKINNGQIGLATSEWEKVACLHTVFSRAKDGLVIFVV